MFSLHFFSAKETPAPTIYLNTFEGEGEEVFQLLTEEKNLNFNLAEITDLRWEHDMSPWEAPAIAKGEGPFTGGADSFLKTLDKEIVPLVEENSKSTWRGIAGYSLAGLFALYSMYRLKKFVRVASVSGSLWFPGFLDFAKSKKILQKPECIYLSLGDKEAKSKNQYLATVQENTAELFDFYTEKNISATFELNSGGHVKDVVERTARGLEWILTS